MLAMSRVQMAHITMGLCARFVIRNAPNALLVRPAHVQGVQAQKSCTKRFVSMLVQMELTQIRKQQNAAHSIAKTLTQT
jgi:hypothetical protein